MPFFFVTVPTPDDGSNFLMVAANTVADVEAVLHRNQVTGRGHATILAGVDAESEFLRQYSDCSMLSVLG